MESLLHPLAKLLLDNALIILLLKTSIDSHSGADLSRGLLIRREGNLAKALEEGMPHDEFWRIQVSYLDVPEWLFSLNAYLRAACYNTLPI
ncbi:hypothetical protein Krac_11917 [Ktedonobacter racemifer DSM 44963]|uniref:Uncharacterized protein n=1 Tax=Ktedonobacter racemifer DSM 44963 TaxID=485913 RepID=D6TEC8_KTERA|nr:hypothetical protein Krac_11917 [Ktedonobacter racemifer DSM 44963]